MNIISRAWQWLFPERSFAIELHTDVPTAIQAVRARLDARFFNPFHTGFVGRANERVVKVRYQRAWQGNSSAPVFVGRFQSEHGRSYLVGHCRAPISTRISVAFWLGFVTLWWILALIATMTQPEPGIPLPLVLTVPPLMLAFGVGMCRLGLRLARGDAEEIQSMLESVLAPALPGAQSLMSDQVNDPAFEFSSWLHDELVSNYANETEAWALDRVSRVMERLNGHRQDRAPLETIILWAPAPSAFTTVGKYLYITRPLLERLPDDDSTAFWLGHEAAHHDLGHLDLFGQWAQWIPRISGAGYIAAIARLLEYRAYGAEKEADADAYAIELCVDAGYDGDKCLQAFDVLENLSLDRGDIDGVFGPENLLDPTDPGNATALYAAQRWLWTKARGYLPVRERRERVKRHLERKRARAGRRT